jgi:acetylornithine deacetylase/succinyl-diaminopimelate desuccinylase-like protein
MDNHTHLTAPARLPILILSLPLRVCGIDEGRPMNAPATPTSVRPDDRAGAAPAHQPNEWVTLDQLAQCEAFMRRLADRMCVA